jgi:hypothetical protein
VGSRAIPGFRQLPLSRLAHLLGFVRHREVERWYKVEFVKAKA